MRNVITKFVMIVLGVALMLNASLAAGFAYDEYSFKVKNNTSDNLRFEINEKTNLDPLRSGQFRISANQPYAQNLAVRPLVTNHDPFYVVWGYKITAPGKNYTPIKFTFQVNFNSRKCAYSDSDTRPLKLIEIENKNPDIVITPKNTNYTGCVVK